MENTYNTPKLMTVRQIARMIKEGVLQPLYSGNRALLNFNMVCTTINKLTTCIA